MTPDQVLHELETLPHAARVRRMVILGRSARSNMALSSTLTTLAQGNIYERWMALHSCFGSYNSAQVLHALHDPADHIRALAVRLVPLVCDEERMRLALTTVSGRLRVLLLWKLHKQGYTNLIDTFIETLAAGGERQLYQLLPFASRAVVLRHLDCIRQQADGAPWCHLARFHPALVVDELSAQIEHATFADVRLVWLFNLLLPILVHEEAERLLALVKALLRHVEPDQLRLQPLVDAYPVQAAALVLSSHEYVPVTFTRGVRRLETGQICALVARDDETLELEYAVYNWLPRLAPAQRLAVYTTFRAQLCNESGQLSTYVIALLPTQQREHEAHVHLARPDLAGQPALRLSYAAFLPWHEALDYLKPFLRSPDSNLRMAALRSLISVTTYRRSVLSDLLVLLQTHEHEVAPVRVAILEALADLPVILWQPEHLPHLERMIDQALQAVDMIANNPHAIIQMALAPRLQDARWRASQFAKVVAQCGDLYRYGDFSLQLSAGDMPYFVTALLPVLKGWEERGNVHALLALACGFGRYVQAFVPLVDMLERLLQLTDNASVADSILALLIKYLPERAARLIPELMEQDAGWINRSPVALYLLRKRQDLLTPLLSAPPDEERFGTAELHFILRQHSMSSRRRRSKVVLPICRRYLWAWTFTQQRLFEHSIVTAIHDEAQDNGSLLGLMTLLAALPVVPVQEISALADDPRPVLYESALRALARLESGEGIPVVLRALDDDERARVAINALRPFFLVSPPEQVLSMLKNIPWQKVGVAKEFVRLLGTLPLTAAYEEILRLEGQELHRDARIALLRTLWRHPEREETWEILERNARSLDVDIALSTVRLKQTADVRKEKAIYRRTPRRRNRYKIFRRTFHTWWEVSSLRAPLHHLTLETQRYLMKAYAILLEHPRQEVHAVVLRYCNRSAAADNDGLLLAKLLQSVDSALPEEAMLAANAVFHSCSADDALTIGEAIASEKDNRRALRLLARGLWLARAAGRRKATLSIVYTVLDVLTDIPLTVILQLELALLTLAGEDVAALLKRFVAHDTLHADAVHEVCTHLSSMNTGEERATVEVLERLLAAESDERLRRIALAALVSLSQSPSGWNDERTRRLHVYQSDPSPLVAESALFTFPEQSEGENI